MAVRYVPARDSHAFRPFRAFHALGARRVLPVVALAALALAPFASAEDEAAKKARGHVRHVVIQVASEPNYQASDLEGLLNDPGYVGAIAGNLVPTAFADVGVAAEPQIVLAAARRSQEILVLSFSGASAEAVGLAVNLVVSHLEQLQPTRHRMAQQRIATARARLATWEQERLGALERLAIAQEQHGVDPHSLFVARRDERARTENELADVERDLAETRATRDYLRSTTRRETAGAGDAERIAGDLAAAERELAALRSGSHATDPAVAELESRIARLKLAAEVGPAPGVVPRELLETELFEVERRVFERTSRRDWLANRIAELRAEEQLLSRSDVAVRDRRRDFEDADLAMRDARHALAQAEQVGAELAPGAWLRVIAR
jgi:hypothetical protein